MSEFFRHARDKLTGNDHSKNEHYKKLSSKYSSSGESKDSSGDGGEDSKESSTAGEVPQSRNVQEGPKK